MTLHHRTVAWLQDAPDACKVVCLQEIETTEHILVQFVYARQVWYSCSSKLRLTMVSHICLRNGGCRSELEKLRLASDLLLWESVEARVSTFPPYAPAWSPPRVRRPGGPLLLRPEPTTTSSPSATAACVVLLRRRRWRTFSFTRCQWLDLGGCGWATMQLDRRRVGTTLDGGTGKVWPVGGTGDWCYCLSGQALHAHILARWA
jgi:hypothetical protein